MAPSTRTRPLSASSIHSHNAAALAPSSSCFMDRSGVLGLEGGSKSDRPLPELLNLLLDAAHQSHESRSALHPSTQAYTLFTQRAAGAGSGIGGPPISLDPSQSLTSLAAHSSLAVYAWGDVSPRGQSPPAIPNAASRVSAAAATSASAAASTAVGMAAPAASSVAAPRPPAPKSEIVPAHLDASRHLPAAPTTSSSKAARAPSPLRPAAGPAKLQAPQPAPPTSAKPSKITKTGATKPTTAVLPKTAPAMKAAAAKPAATAAKATTTVKSAPAPGLQVPKRAAATAKAAAAGLRSSQKLVAASPSGPATAGACVARTIASSGLTPEAPLGGPSAASPARGQRAAVGIAAAATAPLAAVTTSGVDGGVVEQDYRPAVRRVKSASNAGPVTVAGGGGGGVDGSAAIRAAAASAGDALTLGSGALEQRGPRQIARPEVVARALSPWVGAELEVVCLYDSNFQTANRQGQHGVPLRVPARTHIGPISYLYRWYCKRATQFRTPLTSADLPDAPAMPPAEEAASVGRAAAAAGSGPFGNSRSGSAARGGRPASASASGGGGGGDDDDGRCGSAGNGAAAAMWLRKATSLRCHGGPSVVAAGGCDATACGGDGGGRDGLAAERPVTSSGRRLNYALDPVISLSEVVDLLEDLEIVPQLASRLDVTKICNAAAAAAAANANAPANPTATAAAAWLYGTRQPTLPPAPPPQQQPTPWRSTIVAAPVSGRPSTSVTRRRPTSATAAPTAGSKTDPWVTAFGGGGANSSPGPRARPASAPRVMSKPAVDGYAGGGGGGHVIPRTQPHPEEVRFPVFKDVMVRLAVALACVDPPTAVGAGAAGTRSLSSIAVGSGAVVGSASPYGWGRTMSAEAAEAAVRRLLELMQLHRNGVRELKHRLDHLARLAKEHAVRAHANRMRYIAVPSPVEAAQDVAVAPGPSPPPPGARPGLPGRPLPPWGVLAAAPAPPYLTAVLAEEDQGDEWRYHAAWREFGAVALDLGLLQPGELRRCRLLLHSRGPHVLSVRVDTSEAPFCDVSHVGLHSVPPGMPLRVDVTVRLYDIGEVVGELRLRYNSSQDRREREIAVPIYGMVCPPSGGDGARTRPRSASERSVLAAKAARGPLPRAVERAALAAAPLGHCGPPRRGPPSSPPPLSASSSHLAGYCSGSTTDLQPASQVSWRSATAAAAAAGDAPAAAAADAASAVASKAAASVRWTEASAGAGGGGGGGGIATLDLCVMGGGETRDGSRHWWGPDDVLGGSEFDGVRHVGPGDAAAAGGGGCVSRVERDDGGGGGPGPRPTALEGSGGRGAALVTAASVSLVESVAVASAAESEAAAEWGRGGAAAGVEEGLAAVQEEEAAAAAKGEGSGESGSAEEAAIGDEAEAGWGAGVGLSGCERLREVPEPEGVTAAGSGLDVGADKEKNTFFIAAGDP